MKELGLGFSFHELESEYGPALRILLMTRSPDHGLWPGIFDTLTANQRDLPAQSLQVHILGILSSKRKSYGTRATSRRFERGFRTVLGSCEQAGDWEAGCTWQ